MDSSICALCVIPNTIYVYIHCNATQFAITTLVLVEHLWDIIWPPVWLPLMCVVTRSTSAKLYTERVQGTTPYDVRVYNFLNGYDDAISKPYNLQRLISVNSVETQGRRSNYTY